jgi:hypothetical protein
MVSECFCPQGAKKITTPKANDRKGQQCKEKSGVARRLHTLLPWKFCSARLKFTSQKLAKNTRRQQRRTL